MASCRPANTRCTGSNATCRSAGRAWRRARLEASAREPALFLSGYGERLSAGYLGNWVRRVLESIGVERPSCHLLRHSCATHMLENGADIRFIQPLLGHARLDTIQIYTEVTIHQLREVHARCHPHGRKLAPAAPPAAPNAAPAQSQSSL